MAGSQRQQRVQETLKETISEVIRMVKDPRLGFVTVTGVEVSPDLSYARVFFSAYGTDEERKDSLEALKHAAGFVRREVARRVQLRHTPEIDFRLDTTPDRAERIMQLLHEIEVEDAGRTAPVEPAPISPESDEESTASPSPTTVHSPE
ncbi:MAG TPA: 30S ribosome-binding factor RbfA [Armatimonadota bacterium]|nr:30S ribosome-binding factor RbfA [Armatimonadota bacterium]